MTRLDAGLVAALGALCLAASAGPPNAPVRDALATMVEQVSVSTGVSFTISESTPTSVNISQVNGRSVCAAEARSDVERVQQAFDRHPSISRNIGPALVSITDRDGTKHHLDPADANGVLKACTNIYVSVRD